MKLQEITLKNQNNEDINFSDYKGKWLVLYFYPKDNTPGCTKEAQDFSDLSDEFKKLNCEIIGVSPDSIESHKKFTEKFNLKINLLSDSPKELIKSCEAWGIKKNYGKEYEGLIRTTLLINPELEVVKTWKNVRVRVKKKSGEVKHAELVLQELKKILDKDN